MKMQPKQLQQNKKSTVSYSIKVNKVNHQSHSQGGISRLTTVSETQYAAVSAPSLPSFLSSHPNQNMNWSSFQFQTHNEAT